MIGLTPRQADLLAYLRERWPECPSYREMGAALGFSANNLTAPISQLLDGLEEKGHIRRLRNRARAIELLSPPTRLGVVFGPDHFECLAEVKRRRWAREEAKAA